MNRKINNINLSILNLSFFIKIKPIILFILYYFILYYIINNFIYKPNLKYYIFISFCK